ncbi:hypothetical protein L7F22_057719 [Adiantum nelumboides]|nr:hypothetical protein [Adiantum nelumboides]
MTNVKAALVAPLQDLPKVEFAFAYGSGVFQQPGSSKNEVSSVAQKVGAGVHFNAFVPWKDKLIKYGVVGMDNLVEDILSWKSLYISGRLQKPGLHRHRSPPVGGASKTTAAEIRRGVTFSLSSARKNRCRFW